MHLRLNYLPYNSSQLHPKASSISTVRHFLACNSVLIRGILSVFETRKLMTTRPNSSLRLDLLPVFVSCNRNLWTIYKASLYATVKQYKATTQDGASISRCSYWPSRQRTIAFHQVQLSDYGGITLLLSVYRSQVGRYTTANLVGLMYRPTPDHEEASSWERIVIEFRNVLILRYVTPLSSKYPSKV